jgi:hypothetical protein
MTVKIRAIHSDDKPALMKILRDTREFKPVEVAVAEEVIDSCLKDPINSGYHTLIAEDNSEIAGYICYGPTPLTDGTWDLYWAAVAQDRRGRYSFPGSRKGHQKGQGQAGPYRNVLNAGLREDKAVSLQKRL